MAAFTPSAPPAEIDRPALLLVAFFRAPVKTPVLHRDPPERHHVDEPVVVDYRPIECGCERRNAE
jgi:hypothetical protein